MGVGNVNLNNRSFHRFYRVPYSYGSVGISRCIQDDTIILKAHFLDFVDELSLHIGLKIG